MKDPWFNNIRPVTPEKAINAVHAHAGASTVIVRNPRVFVVVDCPKRLREALSRGR